ncbi:MAG: hypothetical protein WBX15_08080 [Thermoanaerobaculia bacterium]
MSDVPIDQLRRQLRELGYLTRGLERWFALDPWRSRTFWTELTLLGFKASVLVGAFAMFPMLGVMLMRNHLPLREAAILGAGYFLIDSASIFALILLTALTLKLRPSITVESPVALLAVSAAVAAIVVGAIWFWWSRFPSASTAVEAIVGGILVLILFVIGTLVFSAAFLSFSIHETGKIPSIHRRSRLIPILLIGIGVVTALLLPPQLQRESDSLKAPSQVSVTPTRVRLVVIAVDGLTSDVFAAREDLGRQLPHRSALGDLDALSSAERWASIGTGTPERLHRVQSIEGVRIATGGPIIQARSAADPILGRLGATLHLTRTQPLPPTVRRRDYVWEILARHGVPSVAVNWWSAGETNAPNLRVMSQESIFRAARRRTSDPSPLALEIDRLAVSRLESAIEKQDPRFATIYLPALDIVLNRLDLDPPRRLAASVTILDGVSHLVAESRRRGYEVIVIGSPGSTTSGSSILASTIPLRHASSPWDLGPTILQLFGFPTSAEMPGSAIAEGAAPPEIPTYGSRDTRDSGVPVDREYYQSLRSLGYIR